MRQIKLPNGRITTSLGFGCSSLFRLPYSADRQQLLDLAFDMGIRHFDVARMYGLGHAEAELGHLLRRQQDKITVATKFGLGSPNPPSSPSQHQSLLRQIIQSVPGARSLARSLYSNRSINRDFSSSNCRLSCQTSLKQLKLENIDLFLLHEPSPVDVIDPELSDCLQQLHSEGLIGGYGLSGMPEDSYLIWKEWPQLAHHLIQMEDNLFRPDPFAQSFNEYSRLKGRYGRIRSSLQPIQHAFKMVPQLQIYWSNRLNVNLSESTTLASVVIAACMELHPNDLILFSSTNASRLRRTLSLLIDPPWQLSDLIAFESFWRCPIL